MCKLWLQLSVVQRMLLMGFPSVTPHTKDTAMAPLPLQVRLDQHHLTALDGARVVTDPASGLTVTLSRQQVLLGILDQWIAAQEPQPRAVTETATDTAAPQTPPRPRKRQAAPAD